MGVAAAATSLALVGAGLGAVGTAAAAPPAAQQISNTVNVTFTGCELTDKDGDRVGDTFIWTTPMTLTVESPVSGRDLDHVVRLDVPNALPWPGGSIQLDNANAVTTFRFAAGSDGGTLLRRRTYDGTTTFGPTFAIGELSTDSHVYGLAGHKAWKPRSVEVTVRGNAPGTSGSDGFRNYTLTCDPVRNAPTILTAAVYDLQAAARLSLRRANGRGITTARQGARVRFEGTDFEPLGSVAIKLGKRRVATVRADVTGAVVGRFRVPPTARAKPWIVNAVGSSARKSAQVKHLYVQHRKVKLKAPARKRAGARVRVVAAGFVAKERVRVQLRVPGKRRARAATVVRANKKGRITTRLRTARVPRGYYRVVVTGRASGRNADRSIYLR